MSRPEFARSRESFGHAPSERANPRESRNMNRGVNNTANRPGSAPSQFRPAYSSSRMEHEDGLGRPESRAEFRQLYGRGQEHLPQWWATHRGLDPRQQAQAMRRQRGFRNLPQRQQQMLLNRLHDFDRRPPAQQRRMLGRVEMFERLSPERQQEVRGAAQAYRQMPAVEKERMRGAFQQLRMMPPAERRAMLNSTYGRRFTPQERTVLGNMLSIEPYQPSQP